MTSVWFVAIGSFPVVRNSIMAVRAGPGTAKKDINGGIHMSTQHLPKEVPWSSPWRTTRADCGASCHAIVEASVGVLDWLVD